MCEQLAEKQVTLSNTVPKQAHDPPHPNTDAILALSLQQSWMYTVRIELDHSFRSFSKVPTLRESCSFRNLPCYYLSFTIHHYEEAVILLYPLSIFSEEWGYSCHSSKDSKPESPPLFIFSKFFFIFTFILNYNHIASFIIENHWHSVTTFCSVGRSQTWPNGQWWFFSEKKWAIISVYDDVELFLLQRSAAILILQTLCKHEPILAFRSTKTLLSS